MTTLMKPVKPVKPIKTTLGTNTMWFLYKCGLYSGLYKKVVFIYVQVLLEQVSLYVQKN